MWKQDGLGSAARWAPEGGGSPASPGASPEEDSGRLRQQLAEARAALETERVAANQRLLRAEIKAAAVRLGAHDPNDLLKLIDTSAVAIGKDGEAVGLDEFLAAVKAAKPWAFSGPSPTGQPAGATTSSTARAPAGKAATARITDLPQAERKAALRKLGLRL